MKRISILWVAALLLLPFSVKAKEALKETTLHLYATTDIHGNFFSYDFMTDKPINGGLARISTYLNGQRAKYGKDNCLLFDTGDILQGQPCVYYSNFVDTQSPLLASEVMNYLQCDAQAFGNHDIEAGIPVFTRWVKDAHYPILGANILYAKDHSNYAKPYVVIQKNGVKIALLGLITPAIPMWVPEKQWKGLYFEDIVKSARRWVAEIQKKEKPDVLIGLFHSGLESEKLNGFNENASREIARTVPGFDLIFYGHDHQAHKEVVKSRNGQNVLLLNAGARGMNISEAVLNLKPASKGAAPAGVDAMSGATTLAANIRRYQVNVTGDLVSMKDYAPDSAFLNHFNRSFEATKAYVHQPVGKTDKPIVCVDAFFGNSTLADLIHQTQLTQTNADFSLLAPLTTNQVIPAGPLCVKDIFTIYPYENMINLMTFTGKEIKGALEKSYGMWTNQMKSPEDHLIALKQNKDGSYFFKNMFFFLVQAGGLTYEVDVTKPVGQRVNILKTRDGKPFDLHKTYKVAVNSYLGQGGGSILTEGAGIPLKDLSKRIVSTSDLDLRHYIIEYVKGIKGSLSVPHVTDWKFVPESLVKSAIERDKALLAK